LTSASTRRMWMQLVLCVSSTQSELLVSVVRFASTRRRQASSMVKYRKFHRKRQRRSILVRHTVRQTGYCLIRCMSSTNFTLKLDLPPNVVVVECIYEPHVFSHSVGTSSAECICCSSLSYNVFSGTLNPTHFTSLPLQLGLYAAK